MASSVQIDRLVLDGSVALAWLFQDEQDPYADAIVEKLPSIMMLVPRLWHLEILNVLLVGERRGRCTSTDTSTWLTFLTGLPVHVDTETETSAWAATAILARQHGLTSYDASYLELAIREKIPLATLDKKLKAVAGSLGILYQP